MVLQQNFLCSNLQCFDLFDLMVHQAHELAFGNSSSRSKGKYGLGGPSGAPSTCSVIEAARWPPGLTVPQEFCAHRASHTVCVSSAHTCAPFHWGSPWNRSSNMKLLIILSSKALSQAQGPPECKSMSTNLALPLSNKKNNAWPMRFSLGNLNKDLIMREASPLPTKRRIRGRNYPKHHKDCS